MAFTDTIYHFYTPFNHNSEKIKFYTCTVFEIDGKRRDSKSFNTHLDEKSNDDVKILRFMRTKNFKEISSKFYEIFKNIEILIIEDCKISEIRRKNFEGFENLREFLVLHSEMKFLPGNLFDDLKLLECFGFINSKISSIEENLLNGMKNLKAAYLVQNPVINAVYVDNESSYQLPPLHQYGHVTKVPSILELHRLIKNCSPCSSLCSDIKNLLSKESHKDFTITIKNSSLHGSECLEKCCNEIYKIHKFLLIARSEIFSKMVLTLPDVKNLNLIDVPSNVFKKIVEYLYDGILPKNDQHLRMKDVFVVANKLGLRELKNYAKNEMIRDGCGGEILVEDNKFCDVELREGENMEDMEKYEENEGKFNDEKNLKFSQNFDEISPQNFDVGEFNTKQEIHEELSKFDDESSLKSVQSSAESHQSSAESRQSLAKSYQSSAKNDESLAESHQNSAESCQSLAKSDQSSLKNDESLAESHQSSAESHQSSAESYQSSVQSSPKSHKNSPKNPQNSLESPPVTNTHTPPNIDPPSLNYVHFKSPKKISKEQEEEYEDFVKIPKNLNFDQFEVIDDFYSEVCSLEYL